MSDIDMFGYQRSKVGSYLVSSDYAAVYFTDPSGALSANKAGLVQSASVSYQHQVQPRFESGSSELYWLTGQPMGRIGIGRLVGDRGILDGISFNDNPGSLKKGLLGNVEFQYGRLGLTDVTVNQSVLVMSGCVLAGVGFNHGTGSFDIQEALTIDAALMKSPVIS